MSPQKRRNRLLAVRLTDEEYCLLKAACAGAGGHNLSEFARAGLLTLLRSDPAQVADRLCSLENRLADIQVTLCNGHDRHS